MLPDYAGACIANLVPRLLGTTGPPDAGEDWMPGGRHARQIVLLVIDGLGWEQLRARSPLAPTLSAGAGIDRAITSIAPTTTAAALTSITTGRPPSEHGILGYRLADGDPILNMLRWTLGSGPGNDARRRGPGPRVPAHRPLRRLVRPGAGRVEGRVRGHRVHRRPSGRTPRSTTTGSLSSLAVEVGRRLRDGAPFVYAYYDGIDKVAHAYGLGPHYDAELPAVDRMVADVVDQLPAGAVLLVTADHGQIEVGPRVELLGREAMAMITSSPARAGSDGSTPARARPATWPSCSTSCTATPPGSATATGWSTTGGSAVRWPAARPTGSVTWP